MGIIFRMVPPDVLGVILILPVRNWRWALLITELRAGLMFLAAVAIPQGRQRLDDAAIGNASALAGSKRDSQFGPFILMRYG